MMESRRTWARLVCALVLAGLIGASAAPADDYVWTRGGGNDNWSDAQNWDPTSGPPGTNGNAGGDVAAFTSAANPRLNADTTVTTVTVSGSGEWRLYGDDGNSKVLSFEDLYYNATYGSHSDAYTVLGSGGTGTVVVTDGRLMLRNAANDYGETHVNGGELRTDVDGALGAGSVYVNPGGLFRHNVTLTAANTPTFVFNGGTYESNSKANQAPVLVADGTTTTIGGWSNAYLDGVVSGTGTVDVDAGTRYLFLRNAGNTFDGLIVINSGYCRSTAAGAFGTGTVQVNPGGAFQLDANEPAGPVLVGNGGTLQGNNRTWAGEVVLAGGSETTVLSWNSLTISGTVSGSGALDVDAGSRTLTLSGSNPNWTGGATVTSGYFKPTGDMSPGTGTVNVNGGRMYLSGAHSYGTAGNPAAPRININTGGEVRVSGNDGNLDLTFNGGRVDNQQQNQHYTYDGDWDIATSAEYTARPDYGGTLTMAGQVTGSGTFRVNGHSSHPLKLAAASAPFTGAWDIADGRLIVAADMALGDPAGVQVNGGTLQFDTAQSYGTAGNPAAPPITVNDGRIWLRATGVDLNFTLSGGTLYSDSRGGADPEYSGTVTVTADSYFAGRGDYGGSFSMYGHFADGASTGKITYQHNVYDMRLYTANPDFSGGWLIDGGVLYPYAVGSLGTGPVVCKGGVLRTKTPGCLDSPGSITVDASGTLYLDSKEGADVDIKRWGRLMVSAAGASSTVDFGAGGNYTIERGAVIDISAHAMGVVPALADFSGGDSGHGAFIAVETGDWSVGEDSGSIYRGIAAPARNGNFTFSGTVAEAAGPAADVGVPLLSLREANFKLSNAKVYTQGGEPIRLIGPGRFYVYSGNVLGADIDKEGDGDLVFNDAGSLPAGRTANILNGRVLPNSNTAFAGVVNVEAGAALYTNGKDLSSGSVTVKSGAGVSANALSNLVSGVAWDLRPGSQIGLLGNMTGAGTVPGGGVVDYSMTTGDGWHNKTIAPGLALSNSTRLTMSPLDGGGLPGGATGMSSTSGALTLAAGATAGRVCAVTGAGRMYLYNQVNFGAGQLIAGDTSDFVTLGRYGQGFYSLPQAGTVYLDNKSGSASVIGSIDVQAGTLYFVDEADLGGATLIHVAAGATLQRPANISLTTVLTGNGTINVNPTLVPTAAMDAAISPGDSAGVLTVQGHLTFGAPVYTPTHYARLDVDIARSSGTPGQGAYDQLVVTGNVNTMDNAQLRLTLAAPSQQLAPTLTGDRALPNDMTIIDGGGSVGGSTFADFDVAGTDPGGDPVVEAAIAGHWALNTGSAITVSGSDVVLHGSAITWTARAGNANLDGTVDVLDLARLANNFGKTGADWLGADFNLDGVVDVLDLAAIANNFGKSGSVGAGDGGGAPVPEPASLVVLGLGVLALVRRRGR